MTVFVFNSYNWHTADSTRHYHLLNADASAQNFKGILLGDASGNWSNTAFGKNFSNIGGMPLSIQNVHAVPGGKFKICVSLNGLMNVYSMGLKIKYDTNLLKFITAQKEGMNDNYYLFFNPLPSGLKMGIASSIPLKSSGPIIDLFFNASENAKNGDNCAIGISNLVINENNYGDIMQAATFSIGNLVPHEFVLSQNYPNPFKLRTEIRYYLPKEVHVSIEIYNLAGQRIRTLCDKNESAGSYKLLWDGRSEENRVVSDGIYILILRAGSYKITKKMLLIK